MKRPFVALAALLALAGCTAAELPPPEETEFWEPVPPVVSAPAGGVPSDAIVLFDGTSMEAWEPVHPRAPLWKIQDGAMVVIPREASGVAEADQAVDDPKLKARLVNSGFGGHQTKRSFGDIQLHLEFRSPAEIEGEGQGRGNSGIFFMGLYELQVLDSWKNRTYSNGQLGSIYKQAPPLVNPARPPGEWQAYDVVFIAPRFDGSGKVVRPARVTAFLNGVLVQHAFALRGPTVYRGQPKYAAHAARLPLVLQEHADRVAYRNIWVRELSLPETE